MATLIREARPGLSVIFMSGYARPELGESTGEVLLLLEKPFSEATLLQGVEGAIARARRSH